VVRILAIDGPAGSGKSSVSKQVARELGFGYLDTGAAYRALAWAVAEGVVDSSPEPNLEQFKYSISLDPDNFWVRVGAIDVTEAIRAPKIAESVSTVAQMPAVRAFMKNLTLGLVIDSGLPGVVVEGRDITTVVAPDAEIRILLTASEEVRLRRRSAELPEGISIAEQITKRDQNDAKVVDFLSPAPGVELVDSSELDFDSTVEAIIAIIERTK
jgi:cytidylate kinase